MRNKVQHFEWMYHSVKKGIETNWHGNCDFFGPRGYLYINFMVLRKNDFFLCLKKTLEILICHLILVIWCAVYFIILKKIVCTHMLFCKKVSDWIDIFFFMNKFRNQRENALKKMCDTLKKNQDIFMRSTHLLIFMLCNLVRWLDSLGVCVAHAHSAPWSISNSIYQYTMYVKLKNEFRKTRASF